MDTFLAAIKDPGTVIVAVVGLFGAIFAGWYQSRKADQSQVAILKAVQQREDLHRERQFRESDNADRLLRRLVARELVEFRCVLLDFRGHGDSEHVSPPAYNPEHHAADLAQIVASLVKSPYAILGHSAGALAAARFITNARATVPVAMPVAFVWVDLDPL